MALTTFNPNQTGKRAAEKPVATASAAPQWRNIYSISQLNQEVRGLLEAGLPPLWVEGEISNLARPSSGHLYFSLKDQRAQVRCALFRNRSYGLRCKPENGMRVVVRARATLYDARGDYQLLVEEMEDAGAGALQRAFEELKARLLAEGLFDKKHKQALPAMPQRIGVISSASGAAFRDIISVLKRRYPAAELRLFPVAVQGNEAVPGIVRMLNEANLQADCDVLILARGGGSLEDLQAFNHEQVARAIFASKLPLVSGVGHEIDTTIADYVADLRAATPSAAAEAVSPDSSELLRKLSSLSAQLQRATQRLLSGKQQQSDYIFARVQAQAPAQQLQRQQQTLLALERRLQQQPQLQLAARQHQQQNLRQRLASQSPQALLNLAKQRLQQLSQRLPLHSRRRIKLSAATLLQKQHQLQQLNRQQHRAASQQLASLAHSLQAVSPLATLGRGYAIATAEDGKVLHSSSDIAVGKSLNIKLAAGSLSCRVEAQNNADT